MFMAFGQGDIPSVFARLHPDIVWNSPYSEGVPLHGVFKGHEGVGKLFSLFGSAIEILAFTPERFLADGSDVVVLGSEEVRVKATGKTYENRWAHVYTLRDGLIVAVTSYNDTARVAAAY